MVYAPDKFNTSDEVVSVPAVDICRNNILIKLGVSGSIYTDSTLTANNTAYTYSAIPYNFNHIPSTPISLTNYSAAVLFAVNVLSV